MANLARAQCSAKDCKTVFRIGVKSARSRGGLWCPVCLSPAEVEGETIAPERREELGRWMDEWLAQNLGPIRASLANTNLEAQKQYDDLKRRAAFFSERLKRSTENDAEAAS